MNDTITPTPLREAVAFTVWEHLNNPDHPIGNLITALQLLHELTVDEAQALDLMACIFNIKGIADGSITADAFLLPGERLYVTPAAFLEYHRQASEDLITETIAAARSAK
jgi:hypothetical protein